MKTRTAAVLFAILVVLSGCAGTTNQMATTTAGNAETATANDETTEASDEAAQTGTADLPPGVNESGVENATRLLAANRRELADTDYAFRLVRNDSGESPYDYRTVSRGTVAKDFAPFRIRTEREIQYGNQTSHAETDVWGNESVVLVKYHELNRTSYQKYVAGPNETMSPYETLPSQALSGQLSHEYVVAFALLTGEYEVESVESRDGMTLTTLRATELNRSFDERDTENISHYAATLVVDERGRIHRANLTIEFSESTFSYDFELTKLGDVVVAYPPWADRALATGNATGTVTTTAESAMTTTESATATTTSADE